ncbi:MAG TPA: tRNA uridine-5-carboxymethylaminomethyl(34) synthesis GTPase MnmE [Firmicutes bacterium]|nr:tRNA uridine-5-carboxymethylaminomethyl(34) synthesis GTPase MnmE [Bacillota bacterium]
MDDTIAAISTPVGEGGIGIVRISGPRAIPIAREVFRTAQGKRLNVAGKRRVLYGIVMDPATGEQVDEALVTIMPGPASYTREDVVEISCHGGLVPVRRVLEAVLHCGARLAGPGEFTRRAFLNGRIDLAQAEAVIDIIRARTEAAMRRASRQLSGLLSSEVRELRRELVELLAGIEGRLDFPEDIDELDIPASIERCRKAVARIEDILKGARHGRVMREGAMVAIVGKTNVGKSSLLNALLRHERAIVADNPGTTRDTVEDMVDIRGIPVRLVDTAGLREVDDAVERMGIQRALAAMQSADLVLVVVDSSQQLDTQDEQVIDQVAGRPAILVLNKIDLGCRLSEDVVGRFLRPVAAVRVSAKAGLGMEDLRDAIYRSVTGGHVEAGADPIVGNLRHVVALEAARDSLLSAIEAFHRGLPSDIVAIDVRESVERLGEITGETASEAVIDSIFEQFCVGK